MAPRSIDFAALTLRDALDLAAWIEQDASERYRELALQLAANHAPEAANFFECMAGNEERHRGAVERRRDHLFGCEPRLVKPEVFFEVEGPRCDSARPHLSHREALMLALQSEERAFDFFAQALPRVHDPAVKDLLQELIGEELEHQHLVKAELRQLPLEDGPTRGGEGNEPHVR